MQNYKFSKIKNKEKNPLVTHTDNESDMEKFLHIT